MMEGNYRCWKAAQADAGSEQKVLRLGEESFTLQDATEEQIRQGAERLCNWYLERKYKTQVAGLGRVYYEMRSEYQNFVFEELIFSGGQCIGACHDELVFLFDDEKTHSQKKYLGSVPVSHDQQIDYYDFYELHFK